VLTIEKHLADCIVEGRAFDLARFVSDDDYLLVAAEVARTGAERLKPLRDALPDHINYRIIRFVVADMERKVEGQKSKVEGQERVSGTS
jgi:ATP-dependent DNA helicase RecQ